jgi:predicted transcriptional regulator
MNKKTERFKILHTDILHMFPELSSIQLRRNRLGLTQNVLSSKAGISQSLLTKIERGLVIPSYKTACDIFDVLDEQEYKKEKTLSDVMKRGVMLLKSTDTAEKAANMAKKYAISQFPVTAEGKVVGAITTNLLVNVSKGAKIKDIMKEPFPTLSSNTPLTIASSLLKQYPAILVLKGGSIIGIATAEDML